jgi:hypothetical protein
MKVKSLILFFVLFANAAFSQNKDALKYASSLDSLRMKTTLTKLCSDEFLGRKSNLPGGDLACDYLIEQLKKNKLKAGNKGSFRQNIEASYQNKSNKYFNLKGFNFKENYSYSNTTQQDSVVSAEDIVFAGYGIHHSTYNDFANIDIKGKIVMVLDGDGPKSKYGVRYDKSKKIPDLDYMKSQEVKAVLVVKRGFRTLSSYCSYSLNFYDAEETGKIKRVEINELLANRILEPLNKSVKQLKYELECNSNPKPFEFKSKLVFNGDKAYKLSKASNVAAIIEGTDLKDEYVVLCAHYDHIGKRYNGKIYHGADDNASGVSSVMEIARVLQKAKKSGKGPRRSVIILFPTAEEDGLCGSKFYVAKPLYPLNKTIACVNVDMLGRMGSKVKAKDIKKGYVYALTSKRNINEKFFNITDSINRVSTKLSLLSSEGSNYSSTFRYSDHYTFHNKNIASILFTNGSHVDLHRTTDTVDKINFTAMLERSKLVFLTVWDLANNSKPFTVKKFEEKIEEEVEIEEVVEVCNN